MADNTLSGGIEDPGASPTLPIDHPFPNVTPMAPFPQPLTFFGHLLPPILNTKYFQPPPPVPQMTIELINLLCGLPNNGQGEVQMVNDSSNSSSNAPPRKRQRLSSGSDAASDAHSQCKRDIESLHNQLAVSQLKLIVAQSQLANFEEKLKFEKQQHLENQIDWLTKETKMILDVKFKEIEEKRCHLAAEEKKLMVLESDVRETVNQKNLDIAQAKATLVELNGQISLRRTELKIQENLRMRADVELSELTKQIAAAKVLFEETQKLASKEKDEAKEAVEKAQKTLAELMGKIAIGTVEIEDLDWRIAEKTSENQRLTMRMLEMRSEVNPEISEPMLNDSGLADPFYDSMLDAPPPPEPQVEEPQYDFQLDQIPLPPPRHPVQDSERFVKQEPMDMEEYREELPRHRRRAQDFEPCLDLDLADWGQEQEQDHVQHHIPAQNIKAEPMDVEEAIYQDQEVQEDDPVDFLPVKIEPGTLPPPPKRPPMQCTTRRFRLSTRKLATKHWQRQQSHLRVQRAKQMISRVSRGLYDVGCSAYLFKMTSNACPQRAKEIPEDLRVLHDQLNRSNGKKRNIPKVAVFDAGRELELKELREKLIEEQNFQMDQGIIVVGDGTPNVRSVKNKKGSKKSTKR